MEKGGGCQKMEKKIIEGNKKPSKASEGASLKREEKCSREDMTEVLTSGMIKE